MRTIGITMGDPSGVGPEIICKALAALPAPERAAALVIGDPGKRARANTLCETGRTCGDAPDAVPEEEPAEGPAAGTEEMADEDEEDKLAPSIS